MARCQREAQKKERRKKGTKSGAHLIHDASLETPCKGGSPPNLRQPPSFL